MKNAICRAFCFFLLLTFIANAQEIRSWTSGKFKTEAEFVKLSDDGKTVTLKKKGGKEISVVLEKLSKIDRDYVESKKKASIKKEGVPKPDKPKSISNATDCVNTILSGIDDDEDRNIVRWPAKSGQWNKL